VKRTALVALLVAVVTAGCNDVPAPASYAVVYGRVYDATTDAPLAGVTVTVDAVDVVTTAADGTYSVIDVPAGPTDVTVAPPAGYALGDPSILTFSVRPGDNYRLDLPLKGS
jgi:hypothetical protein